MTKNRTGWTTIRPYLVVSALVGLLAVLMGEPWGRDAQEDLPAGSGQTGAGSKYSTRFHSAATALFPLRPRSELCRVASRVAAPSPPGHSASLGHSAPLVRSSPVGQLVAYAEEGDPTAESDQSTSDSDTPHVAAIPARQRPEKEPETRDLGHDEPALGTTPHSRIHTEWPIPSHLLARLERLEETPAANSWANEARDEIERLGSFGPKERAAALTRLLEQCEQAQNKADALATSPAASSWRRAAYALARHAKVLLPLAEREGDDAVATVEVSTDALESRYGRNDLIELLDELEATRQPSVCRELRALQLHLASSNHPADKALAEELENQYRSCNLRLAVSAEFLNRLIPQRPPTDAPVAMQVGDLPVSGTSTTTTKTRIQMIPDDNALKLVLDTQGTVHSTTSADKGPVTVYNRGELSFTARSPLLITKQGFVAGEPQLEILDNQNWLEDVQTGLDGVPLIGGMLQKYVRGAHDRRSDEAQQQAESQFYSQARVETAKAVNDACRTINARLDGRIWAPLKELGLDPPWLIGNTTPTRLVMRTRLAAESQLGSFTPRPRAPSDSWLSLQIHESSLNNLVERLDLGGKTYTVEQLIRHVTKSLHCEDWKPTQELPRDVTITFAEADAFSLVAEDDRLELRLQLAEFAAEGRSFHDFAVRVVLRPEMQGRGVALVRDGPVHLKADGMSSASQLALRGVFSRIFLANTRIELFQGLLDDPRFQELQVTQCVLAEGWLGLALGPRRGSTPALAGGR